MFDDYPTIYETTINENFIYWIILGVILLILLIITILSLGKIFKKANRSGISALIPFYNIVVLLEITNKPKYYFIFYLIPGINLLFHLFTMFSLARLFRKSRNFAVGLTILPFIFYPILAFSDSEYIGINLAAMEGKSTTIDVPKVVEEEEESPVVHEEQDEGSRNINISIGGGVYQKDYTNTLLQVDKKQTISMEPTSPNKPENVKNSFLISEEETLESEPMRSNESALQFPEPISISESKSISNESNSISSLENKNPQPVSVEKE